MLYKPPQHLVYRFVVNLTNNLFIYKDKLDASYV